MRLLKTNEDPTDPGSLKLEEYFGDAIPAYAILSHTWGDDEVLFADIQNQSYTQRKGFEKVKYALEQARLDYIIYLWVDSCCINKDSSTELSEAINSMYTWYADAEKCYAYLVDVQVTTRSAEFQPQFCRSRWWTRGWTLVRFLRVEGLRST